MKTLVVVALLVGAVAPTSLLGGMHGGAGGMGGGMSFGAASADHKLKFMKVGLYLFAPQPWVDTFNAIPAEGQTCLMSLYSDCVTETAAKLSTNNDATKQLVQANCSTYATQINAYVDAVQATFAQLPASFVTAVKQYSDASSQLATQFQQSPDQMMNMNSAASSMSADSHRALIANSSQASATFFQTLSALPDADRQQVATAFPKLQPFLVGANATQLLTQVTQLFQTLSSGQVDMNAMQTQGAALKNAFLACWSQYEAANAPSIEQASQILGKNLTNIFHSSNVAHALGGMSGSSFGNNDGGSFGQSMPSSGGFGNSGGNFGSGFDSNGGMGGGRSSGSFGGNTNGGFNARSNGGFGGSMNGGSSDSGSFNHQGQVGGGSSREFSANANVQTH